MVTDVESVMEESATKQHMSEEMLPQAASYRHAPYPPPMYAPGAKPHLIRIWDEGSVWHTRWEGRPLAVDRASQ